MPVSKEYLEAVSKDPALRAEAEQASLEALGELLEERGLEDEAAKVLEAAAEKVARAHGFEPVDEDEGAEKLSLDELDAVAGGGVTCICPAVGGGGGEGVACGCAAFGWGENDDGVQCFCAGGGAGTV